MHARVCAYIHDVNKCKRWDLRIIFRVWGGCAVLSHHKEGFAAQSGLVGALALRVTQQAPLPMTQHGIVALYVQCTMRLLSQMKPNRANCG